MSNPRSNVAIQPEANLVRAAEATNEEAPSMAQSAKTKCKFECRIFNFQLPFRSSKVWLTIRIVEAKSHSMNE